MSISLDTTSSATAVAALSKVTSNTATSRASDASALAGDTTKVSKPAELLSKLQQLKDTDPTKFKAVMKDLSDKLSAAADSSGDAKLKELADKFAKAGESGDLSSLAPQKKGGGAHAHANANRGGRASDRPPSTMDSFLSTALSEVNDALGGSSAAASATSTAAAATSSSTVSTTA